jgi:hypothetical protein
MYGVHNIAYCIFNKILCFLIFVINHTHLFNAEFSI